MKFWVTILIVLLFTNMCISCGKHRKLKLQADLPQQNDQKLPYVYYKQNNNFQYRDVQFDDFGGFRYDDSLDDVFQYDDSEIDDLLDGNFAIDGLANDDYDDFQYSDLRIDDYLPHDDLQKINFRNSDLLNAGDEAPQIPTKSWVGDFYEKDFSGRQESQSPYDITQSHKESLPEGNLQELLELAQQFSSDGFGENDEMKDFSGRQESQSPYDITQSHKESLPEGNPQELLQLVQQFTSDGFGENDEMKDFRNRQLPYYIPASPEQQLPTNNDIAPKSVNQVPQMGNEEARPQSSKQENDAFAPENADDENEPEAYMKKVLIGVANRIKNSRQLPN